MNYDVTTFWLTFVCFAGCIAYILAEYHALNVGRYVFKMAASTAFVALAIENGAIGNMYGRFILTALVLSWIGDALLLSLRSRSLLAGMAAFFAAHLAFAIAFSLGDLNVNWLVASLLVLMAAASLLLRWLWKYLSKFYRLAVPAYLLAIGVMTSLAISASAATGSMILGVAAILFAVSDVSVARNRFIERNITNKIWGIPLYYTAQILFALSVLSGN